LGEITLLAPTALGPEHILDEFNCGVATLDEWLKRRARANHASGASRCYVIADDTGKVLGYYAVASGALSVADAPGRIKRNMPDPIPMAIVGRLAIDLSQQGKGLGVALLQDAVSRVRQAADIMGIRGVLVHAISEDAKRFYEHHGFTSHANAPMTLVLSLAS
jgi:GNAT superfamily N-acetyltransferase